MFQCCLLCPSRFRFCRFRPEKEVFFFCHFPPLFGLVCTEYEKEGEAGNLQSIFARFEPIFAHFQHVSYEDSSFFGACPNGAFRVPRRSLESPPTIPPLHSRSTWALFRLRRPLFLSSFPIGTFNVNSDPTSSQPRHSSRFWPRAWSLRCEWRGPFTMGATGNIDWVRAIRARAYGAVFPGSFA